MSVPEVTRAAHDYETALVGGDVAAASAWFALDDPDVSRFGPTGESVGRDEVLAARAAQAAVAEPTWLRDDARALGDDVALHLAVLDRGGRTIQRTQVWCRQPDGDWRIVHAHVSERSR